MTEAQTEFKDTDSTGTCSSNTVTCTSPVPGGLVMQVSGNMTDSIQVQMKNTTTGINIQVCVQAALRDSIGFFQVNISVENQVQRYEFLSWSVTVIDENEPPKFQQTTYDVTINETLTTGSTIVSLDIGKGLTFNDFDGKVIEVKDPDKYTDGYQIKAVDAAPYAFSKSDNSFVQLTDFPVGFSQSMFSVTGILDESLIYTFNITVEDGGGLLAVAVLKINVKDVNEAPTCTESSVTVNKTLLADEDRSVTRLMCTDPDYEDAYKITKYKLDGQDKDYFNISSKGVVVIAGALPRDKDVLNFNAVAVDGADPTLKYEVSIVIRVKRDIAATCLVQRNPPDTWVFNSCYNITLGCTDPTTSDSSTLAYQFSGNYTMGFVLTENNGDLVMCYTRTESGTYTINIVVDNGLKATSLNEVIEVQYERSTPKFENLSVKETVLYDVSVGSVLFTVTAVTTGTFAGNIIYLLLGESTPDTALNIFNVGRETGQIRTSSPLRDHIGQKFILKIEALDERSKLKTTASVEVTIDETNLQPKCPKNSEKDSININMIAAVGTVIATVNCTDSNILSKYNTLTYRATGPTNKYFAVDSETGEVSIADQLPFKDTHVLYIEASDSVFSDRTTLVINVDIKLKPTIEVVKVTTSSIKIRWTFERPDYTQYLVKYTIQWEAEGSISQNNVDRGISEYLLNSLKPGTVYFIILMSVAQGFNVSQAVTVKTKEIPVLSLFAVEFRVTDQQWSDAFLQNASAEYTEFKTKTELNIKKALKDVKGIHDVKVINMREGSVFVDSVISVNQSGNVNTTIKAMEMAIARGQVGDASVDPQFSSLYLGGQYVVITSLEVAQINPKEITEGLTLSVSCKARLVGQGLWPLFNWKLKGFSINADLSTRLNVTQSQQAKDRFGFTSVITFRPIKSTDKGSLECIVTDTTEEVKAASKSLLLDVISKPEVTLLPMTLYIKAGEVSTLNCSVETQTGYPVTITWSINNNTVTNIGAFRKDNYEVLNVTNINADARYRCHAKNIAGVVDSNIAIVGPITEEVFCAAFTDDRGISWPIMPAGKTAESQCVGSYKGNALRLCLSNGKWQNTTDLTNCKLELLIQLADKATAKKEGIDIGSTETIANTLANLTSKTLVSGDLDISIQIMEDVLYVNKKDPDKIIKTDEIKDFVMAADNMLSTSSMEWIDLQRKRKRGASALMKSLDTIGHLASQRAGDVNNSRERLYVHKNLVFEYGKSNATDIQFPRPDFSMYPPWMKLTQTKAFLKSSSYINALNGKQFMGYSGVCYKHMSKLMPGAKLHTRNRGSNSDTVSKMMNSLILSFSLNPRPTNTLDPPLELTFEHLSDNFSNPSCGFLDYSPPYETSGRWSSDGCVVVTKSINLTVCECDHFTNFAILMSPGRTPEKDAWILSIISAIGCAISIFCLVLTIGTYIVLWRYVKTERPDRVIILLNLCVVLIIAYLLFLLGVNRTENADVCTAISVLLHYFYLVVFFLMLAEGIELFVCVIYVFNMRSRLHWLMLMSWGIPAVIVGISLGATQLEGYGNETFCWLSLDNGLLWAFVGPALTVILINCIIVAVVLKTMLSTTAMMTKDAKEKGKAGLKALCVLLPVMGLTWVFGVFSVNENVVIFQYLFAVFNSVQGLFIFIFHCLLSRQVQDGMKNRKRRYLAPSHDTKSTYSQHNVPNKQMSDDTSGNSDMDKKLSPFLEVDRQVQQIAHKLAKVEKENFLDKEEQTKAAGTLDKVNVPTDLPEVKETNMQVLKPDIRRPSPQPVYQQQQTQTQQQLGHSAARQPPLSQEKRLGHRSLQQEASIEENMLQRSPVPQPYRKTVDGKEELKYSRGAAPPQRPVNHQADVKHMEGIIHTSQKRRDDIYNPLKQSKRDKHDYQDLQPRPAGQGHRLAGNSDNSLHEQKYKGCDLPLYIGQADDRWRKVKQAVEMKQFSDHPGPLRRPSQHQSEDDISRYGYYQPFGVPERRLPRTRFSDDDIRFEESFTDYHW
ncbi:uncharacterized protein LOC121370438 [Gigantopelta aegis]|uniref:uncharacterized protein LOC121370438 n=1 Tax=Gigantopelta aegis TaxID=1735272 RepID=UPI001B888664|nr:uncharacterized protein LOC121370438 [Gigantopelta aegis]